MGSLLGMGEVFCELHDEVFNEHGSSSPGFRFHPTDQELIASYLASKVLNESSGGVEIPVIDYNTCEPWEFPDVAKVGDKEWFFFSLKGRNYSTGLRISRATQCGYWKTTGRDKEIYSDHVNRTLLGFKKTLLFYKGDPPRREKTQWVMYEYRLIDNFYHLFPQACKDEWVICKMYQKEEGQKKTPTPFQPPQHQRLFSTSFQPTLNTSTNYQDDQWTETTNFSGHTQQVDSNMQWLNNMYHQNENQSLSPNMNTLTNYQDSRQTETTNFSGHIPQVDPNMQWVHNCPHQNHNQSLLYDMECGYSSYDTSRNHPWSFSEMEYGSFSCAETAHEMSTSIAFDTEDIQSMLMGARFTGAGESEP